MDFIKTPLSGVVLVEPKVFEDPRGSFSEVYRKDLFVERGIPPFVQENASQSIKGVLRGLHYQTAPYEQGKLVRVTRGAIFDVAVDIRPGSDSCGKWFGAILSCENRKMLYIPEGFAHGFLTLEEICDVVYKITNNYSPQHERGIIWNDPSIGIEWPDIGRRPILSEKDEGNPFLQNALKTQ